MLGDGGSGAAPVETGCRGLGLVQQVPPALPLTGRTALALCTVPARTIEGALHRPRQGGEGEQPLAELP